VTISGYHFSDYASDNPVTIGGLTCAVEESSEFEIKCRIAAQTLEASEGQVLIFLKLSEEATCSMDNEECYFTFTNEGLPVLSEMTYEFDDVEGDYFVTITGTNFDETSETTELYIDGYSQELYSITNDTIVFRVTGLSGTYSTDLVLFVSEGIPEGFEII
jgi:hypothetical protein